MLVSEIELFEALSEQLGKEKARVLVQYVENKIEKNIDQKKDVFLTKEDKVQIIEKISETKTDLMKWMFGIFSVIMLSIIGLYFKR
jgi:predicted DNA-binding protein